MKKVLVIGAHSYIGQKFKEYISINKLEDLTVEMVSASDGAWRKVDFSGYDTILHLSGIVHRKEKKCMESLYYEVNHKLAVEIAKIAKLSHVKQFIFMSTAAVYGSNVDCITKETMPNPTTLYGKSKLAAEKDIIKLQGDDFRVAIVRPPMVYGEGCKGNYTRLVKLAKYTPVFPEFHNKRSVLNIIWLCKHIYELISKENGGLFYPQDSEYMDTCNEIVKIRKRMGKKTVLIKGFGVLVKLGIVYIETFKKIFKNLYYESNLL